MTRKIKKSLKQDWETDMETTIRETTQPDVLHKLKNDTKNVEMFSEGKNTK